MTELYRSAFTGVFPVSQSTACHPPVTPHSGHGPDPSSSSSSGSSSGWWRIALLLLVVLTGILALTGSAAAQDPCDVNPDAPECNVSIFEVQPAGPETCPAGGWVFIVLGAPYPVCNGAPGATGAPGAPGAPAPPNPASVVQQVINTPVISPAQPAGCFSRRRFDVSIPQRFRWGTRVKVIVGGETQHDGGVPSTFVRQNHRVRVDLRARPCGVYAVVVTKRGKTPWARLYTAGPNGNMTGYNLAMARR